MKINWSPLLALAAVPLVLADFAAYVPNWAVRTGVDVGTLNYQNVNEILYAFFTVDGNGNVVPTNKAWDDINIPKINALKGRYGFTLVASIGGWTNSTYFSQAFSTAQGRQNFVNSVWTNLITSNYAFDGVDIDWEYPGASGYGCNTMSNYDFQNYNLVLQLLRQKLGWGRPITVALGATVSVYRDVNGTNWIPVWAQQLTHINIMTYDYSGNWNPFTGIGTPIYQNPSDPLHIISIQDTLRDYVKTLKVDRSKLRLGLEFNGHSFYPIHSDANHPDGLYQNCPLTNASDITSGACTVIQGDFLDDLEYDGCNWPATNTGDWSWRGLRTRARGGILSSATTPVAGSGWVRTWHSDVMAPTLLNNNTGVFITYDDVQSIAAKVKFAKQWNLGGVFAWEMSEDYYDPSSGINGELITAAVAQYQGITKRFIDDGNAPAGTVCRGANPDC
ncbi:glycoside hydrolase superfamily [Polychytrium aggregatum]|uniref:glycoside hydrolase superfamily n=1 Tax=Polychytrium aggregatum TaxID=110093 RepID=UPI0022FDE02A|nr:glycoside hydrolase superfamily [Polychytrium aggregatum]KAI9207074.1 glycoside hydrolase superfamily [Polychytrium aggregatum]